MCWRDDNLPDSYWRRFDAKVNPLKGARVIGRVVYDKETGRTHFERVPVDSRNLGITMEGR